MGIKCFWLEETNRVQLFLRRYHDDCKAKYRFLNGMVQIEPTEVPAREMIPTVSLDTFKDDPRWVAQCDCGHVYDEHDMRTVFRERIYRRADTGEEYILRDAPVGAMWDAWWSSDWCKGPDGRCLVVKCPEDGHEWMIDSRANNCTLPNDKEHRCWCRHGEPPLISVDKDGLTCSAGTGSILTKTWHGYLKNGEFTTAD